MRFVSVKRVEQQASGVVFRGRDLLVHQRAQLMNALRGHQAEYGHVVPKSVMDVDRLIAEIEDPGELPQAARVVLVGFIRMLDRLDTEIALLDAEIARRAKEDAVARRLMTIPRIGPVTAAAGAGARSVPLREGLSAWVGLTPVRGSTGRKQKLGQITKAGERTLRRLLVIGASAVSRQALIRGARAGSWLA